jgi:hypothetical protein
VAGAVGHDRPPRRSNDFPTRPRPAAASADENRSCQPALV